MIIGASCSQRRYVLIVFLDGLIWQRLVNEYSFVIHACFEAQIPNVTLVRMKRGLDHLPTLSGVWCGLHGRTALRDWLRL